MFNGQARVVLVHGNRKLPRTVRRGRRRRLGCRESVDFLSELPKLRSGPRVRCPCFNARRDVAQSGFEGRERADMGVSGIRPALEGAFEIVFLGQREGSVRSLGRPILWSLVGHPALWSLGRPALWSLGRPVTRPGPETSGACGTLLGCHGGDGPANRHEIGTMRYVVYQGVCV